MERATLFSIPPEGTITKKLVRNADAPDITQHHSNTEIFVHSQSIKTLPSDDKQHGFLKLKPLREQEKGIEYYRELPACSDQVFPVCSQPHRFNKPIYEPQLALPVLQHPPPRYNNTDNSFYIFKGQEDPQPNFEQLDSRKFSSFSGQSFQRTHLQTHTTNNSAQQSVLCERNHHLQRFEVANVKLESYENKQIPPLLYQHEDKSTEQVKGRVIFSRTRTCNPTIDAVHKNSSINKDSHVSIDPIHVEQNRRFPSVKESQSVGHVTAARHALSIDHRFVGASISSKWSNVLVPDQEVTHRNEGVLKLGLSGSIERELTTASSGKVRSVTSIFDIDEQSHLSAYPSTSNEPKTDIISGTSFQFKNTFGESPGHSLFDANRGRSLLGVEFSAVLKSNEDLGACAEDGLTVSSDIDAKGYSDALNRFENKERTSSLSLANTNVAECVEGDSNPLRQKQKLLISFQERNVPHDSYEVKCTEERSVQVYKLPAIDNTAERTFWGYSRAQIKPVGLFPKYKGESALWRCTESRDVNQIRINLKSEDIYENQDNTTEVLGVDAGCNSLKASINRNLPLLGGIEQVSSSKNKFQGEVPIRTWQNFFLPKNIKTGEEICAQSTKHFRTKVDTESVTTCRTEHSASCQCMSCYIKYRKESNIQEHRTFHQHQQEYTYRQLFEQQIQRSKKQHQRNSNSNDIWDLVTEPFLQSRRRKISEIDGRKIGKNFVSVLHREQVEKGDTLEELQQEKALSLSQNIEINIGRRTEEEPRKENIHKIVEKLVPKVLCENSFDKMMTDRKVISPRSVIGSPDKCTEAGVENVNGESTKKMDYGDIFSTGPSSGLSVAERNVNNKDSLSDPDNGCISMELSDVVQSQNDSWGITLSPFGTKNPKSCSANRNDIPIQAGAAMEFFKKLQLEVGQNENNIESMNSNGNSTHERILKNGNVIHNNYSLSRLRLAQNGTRSTEGGKGKSSNSSTYGFTTSECKDRDKACNTKANKVEDACTKLHNAPKGSPSKALTAAGSGVIYINSDELEDFTGALSINHVPDVLLPSLSQPQTKADWKCQTESLNELRRVVKFRPHMIQQDFVRRLVGAVLNLLSSPRSTLAKTAALTLTDLFAYGKQRLDSAIADVIDICVRKTGQSSEFLNECVRDALIALCLNLSEAKLFPVIAGKLGEQRIPKAKAMTVTCVAVIFWRMKDRILYAKELPQLVGLLLTTCRDASAEVRKNSKIALRILVDGNSSSGLSAAGVPDSAIKEVYSVTSNCPTSEAKNFLDGLVSRAHINDGICG